MGKYYEHLKWDSDFFGFNVARITRNDISPGDLTLTIHMLKSKNYRLVYWCLPVEQAESVDVAHGHGGFLADKKVTYVKDIDVLALEPLQSSFATVPYFDLEPDSAMIKLAQQSGKYSRFRLDPSFPIALCDMLYACWIKSSVRKEIAMQVLVVKDAKDILGLITIGAKNDRGDIGLLAVSGQAKRKGIGRLLMNDAERYFVENKYAIAQVITQHVNVAACRLYEACGFKVEKIENVFHFWL